MITSNYIELLKNKRGIIVFSDPAGAKACLAIAKELNEDDIILISDRTYEFYNEFGCNVVSSVNNNVDNVFDYVNPEFLLTGTSVPEKIELNYIRKALKDNVKTYSFIDHWTNFKERFSSGGECIYPSELWLIDNESKDIALREGIPENKVRIIGNPYYAYLSNWEPKVSKKKLYDDLGLDIIDNYILYAPEPLSVFSLDKKYGFDELSGLKHIVNRVKENNLTNINILIKGHPNQNDEVFIDYIHKTGGKYYVC